ncbi:MAG: restriction endonuclease [Chloroflexi bacterium]|nr:MAG: restriction endonuclease [Chloroflexota bacterium]
MSTVDLHELVARLADRNATRSEADVQSDVRLLLLHGDLNLEDRDLDVSLEVQAGGRKRIDVEAGYTVIEVKRDLRVGKIWDEAVTQIAEYLRLRTAQMDQRYVGVLTDGAEWHLITLANDIPQAISELHILAATPDISGLQLWLEGVLATRENISPTPWEIQRRLGEGTSSYSLDRVSLASLYAQCRERAEVRVKRMLWARLLTTAFGVHFSDTDEMFIDHTYLVVVADLIAHVAVGLDVRGGHIQPADILQGRYFTEAQIAGVVEADFFDWMLEADGGDKFVRTLARRIARFDWSGVEHDVLKVLYESVINAGQRHSLGEYYTPDWLAERMIDEVVTNPLEERVLDPSCGSGTFVFHAVRHYLAAAEQSGVANADAIEGVVNHVYGVDVHPVAVTLARVTYLLAIGAARLQSRGALTVPVSIGDSLQWGHDMDLFSRDGLVVHTEEGHRLFASELRWPTSVIANSAKFDALVMELSRRATARQPGDRPLPSIGPILDRYGVPDGARDTITVTYQVMCSLHDEGRDHIWSYYVRNLARPYWLTLPEHRVDILVGNPPWLSYRFMTDSMKERFKRDSQERGMWASAQLSTSQDLSGYFVARTTQLYLRMRGRFAFVMPNAVLARPHFIGFRTGHWPEHTESTHVTFDASWDLHAVQPSIFPMPACVVFGTRDPEPEEMGTEVVGWSGLLPESGNVGWDTASTLLHAETKAITRPSLIARSPYAPAFRQGATLTPRSLLVVESLPPGPLGIPQRQVRVRTVKSVQDKLPWKDLPPREGVIEGRFVFGFHLGSSLVPFRCLEPLRAVIPWTGTQLLDINDSEFDEFPALSSWWREAHRLWTTNGKPKTMTLTQRIDYQHLLRAQFPLKVHRVIYNRSGTRLMAAYVSDPSAVIDTKLYWGEVKSREEADYLCAIFNAPVTTTLLRESRPICLVPARPTSWRGRLGRSTRRGEGRRQRAHVAQAHPAGRGAGRGTRCGRGSICGSTKSKQGTRRRADTTHHHHGQGKSFL